MIPYMRTKLIVFMLHDYRYVLECPNCGIIFRSRQFWYGNVDPERSVVRTEIRHVWPGVSLLFVQSVFC